MMQVTKKKISLPLSLSFAFYLISFIFFSGIIDPLLSLTISFTVLEAQGCLDRENPLVVERWILE